MPQLMDDVVNAIVEKGNSNAPEVCSARVRSRQLGLSQITVWKCMRVTLNGYPYNSQRLHELVGCRLNANCPLVGPDPIPP